MKYHQEQRALLDKVNMLQQQLTQVNNTTIQLTAELERKFSKDLVAYCPSALAFFFFSAHSFLLV